MHIGWKYQREPVGTTQCILYYLNHSEGETNLKTQMKIKQMCGKLKNSSTSEHSKELYNTVCVGQAVRSQKTHGRPQTTCTTVHRSTRSSDRSSSGSQETKRRSYYDLTQAFASRNSQKWSCYMVPFTLPTRHLFLRVFWREVRFLMAMARMCRHTGLVRL